MMCELTVTPRSPRAGARDRLAVDDQRQRFQQRARCAAGVLRQAADPRRQLGADLKAVTAGDLPELERTALPFGGQLLEHGLHGPCFRTLLVAEQSEQTVDAQRLAGIEQCGLDDGLKWQRIRWHVGAP